MTPKSNTIKRAVKERYGALADRHIDPTKAVAVEFYDSRPHAADGCCTPTTIDCCTPSGNGSADVSRLADTLYAEGDLSELPDSVTDISLGCGNPTAIASLKAGETVLDLGSGGGIDCFIAARAVGPAGHVIGVDMTDTMLELAHQNKVKLGIENVEFRKGEIEDLPVKSNMVDIIISNCVINLSPDKDAVFREALRVLKPGGRFTVSDIVTEGEIPQPLRDNINVWVGCISGALDQTVYLEKLRQVGFADIAVLSRKSYGIEALDTLDEESRQTLLKGVDWSTLPANARIYSANIVAYKPEM